MKPEVKITVTENPSSEKIVPTLNMAAAQTIFIDQCRGLCEDIIRNPKTPIIELFHKNFPLHVVERTDQIQRFANLFFSNTSHSSHERRKAVEHWLSENNPRILEAVKDRLMQLYSKSVDNDPKLVADYKQSLASIAAVKSPRRRHTP